MGGTLDAGGATTAPLADAVIQLSLLPEDGHGRSRVRVAVSGRVGPRKRVVYLVLQQRVRGRYRTVGTRAVRARAGSFESSFVPAFRALYRYAVVAKSDDDTDRGSTGWRALRVR